MWPKHLRRSTMAATAVVAMVLTTLTTSTAAAGGTLPHRASKDACAKGTTVHTKKGRVCGTAEDGIESWLGIPYATPPVGELRWESPEPHARWKKTLEATEVGSPCPQSNGLGNGSVDEDCLTLNVRAPAKKHRKKLPVMVQLHGGGFRFGAPVDGSSLAKAGNIIYVGVNYRLGIFGYFAHKSLGRHSGNYAIQDQQQALRWVQRNIRRFGGDPHNVTIFGASAGGSSVCINSVSPTARGLFKKGISQSGEYNSLRGSKAETSWQQQDCKSKLPTEAQAQKKGARFATALGCQDASDVAACLRDVPVKTLLKKSNDGMDPNEGTIAPIIDGRTLTMSPGKAFETGHINRVTLMHGVDRDEVQLASAHSPAEYRKLVRQQYGPLAPQVFRHYPLNRFPKPSAFIAYRTIVADSNSVCPALLNDRRMSKHIKVYAYVTENADAPPLFFLDKTMPNGAYHVSENPLLFPEGRELDPNQRALSAQLIAQWTGFARTGHPTVPGTPRWRRFTRHHHRVMSLRPAGDSVMTTELPKQHHCRFWNKHTPFNH